MIDIPIKFLSEDAFTPTNNQGDAGYDLYSIESYTLKPLERHLFKTGLSMEIPNGFYGKICPRSGLALKNGIHVMGGTIDSTYRGDIGIILINLGDKPFLVEKQAKIAQIIFRQYYDCKFNIVDNLSETQRNIGGFGSTGN